LRAVLRCAATAGVLEVGVLRAPRRRSSGMAWLSLIARMRAHTVLSLLDLLDIAQQTTGLSSSTRTSWLNDESVRLNVALCQQHLFAGPPFLCSLCRERLCCKQARSTCTCWRRHLSNHQHGCKPPKAPPDSRRSGWHPSGMGKWPNRHTRMRSRLGRRVRLVDLVPCRESPMRERNNAQPQPKTDRD
jgi:hypothetical protein